MPIRFVAMYSPAELGVTAANWVGGFNGTNDRYLRASPTVNPRRVEINDTDSQNNIFNDGAPGNFGATPTGQRLTGNIDGVQYTNATTNPENEYQATDSDGNIVGSVFNVHSTNSNSFATLQGFVSTFEFVPGETYFLTRISGLVQTNYNNFLSICFAGGTRLQGDGGEVAVEDLAIGDRLLTLDNGLQTVRWIGSRRMAVNARIAPIVFQKGAMGNARELRVSPLHRMLISGWRAELFFEDPEVLVPARNLVNGDTIYQDLDAEFVDYFHILFDRHEVVFAEGIPSESLHPGDVALDTIGQEACEEVYEIFPELRTDPLAYGPTARPALKAHEIAVYRGES